MIEGALNVVQKILNQCIGVIEIDLRLLFLHQGLDQVADRHHTSPYAQTANCSDCHAAVNQAELVCGTCHARQPESLSAGEWEAIKAAL